MDDSQPASSPPEPNDPLKHRRESYNQRASMDAKRELARRRQRALEVVQGM
eukprot:CAMPEP_0194698428 /NCGR_PEP_ID=MMETSP0295-20121207/24084_1 /TAXON_ID=39354 /ORGANISM="Heterosigma akashiwo, Strain CCMP2393" /LENGTH=50 /DNA_ID=CAMNT_0039591425 /DNA_START=22 /DNA_END=171 /DNA_ORIENTATION=-